MEDNDFTSIEKEIIKSLKKEITSREEAERGLAYYKMLFDPALYLAEKAIKRYVKVVKASGIEDISEDTLTYRIVGLFESDLMDRLKGDENENN
jgi:hypothetical protein